MVFQTGVVSARMAPPPLAPGSHPRLVQQTVTCPYNPSHQLLNEGLRIQVLWNTLLELVR